MADLAKVFIKKYYPNGQVKIKEVGSRSGDKLHEDLVGVNDWNREVWSNKEMFILLPATNIYNQTDPPKKYLGFKKVNGIFHYSSKDSIDVNRGEKII